MIDRYIVRNDGVAVPPYNFATFGVTRHFVQDRETGKNVTGAILDTLLPPAHPMRGTRYVSADQAKFLMRIARNPKANARLIEMARNKFAQDMNRRQETGQ